MLMQGGNMKSTTDVDIGGHSVISALQALAAHREALEALVEKLSCEEVVEGLKGVCMVAQLHGLPYKGPSWRQELERAKDVLAQTQTS